MAITDTYVEYPSGATRDIKNLGWLHRHVSQVALLVVTPPLANALLPVRGQAMVRAYLRDGTSYYSTFADAGICYRWAEGWRKRPTFCGVIRNELPEPRA